MSNRCKWFDKSDELTRQMNPPTVSFHRKRSSLYLTTANGLNPNTEDITMR
jgi:hypothetical protein